MKTIVRYANRKLYDLETSKYVSIKEILVFEVGTYSVVDKSTGADLTWKTILKGLSNLPNHELNSGLLPVFLKYVMESLSR